MPRDELQSAQLLKFQPPFLDMFYTYGLLSMSV